jgi:hypothetical protein
MIDLEQLQIIAQLIDNLDIITRKLEKAYQDNDSENFNNSKKEIINIKEQINEILK